MATGRTDIESIDTYIAAFPPEVQQILEKLRQTIQKAAPDAQEVISYRMPAFKRHGMLVYFAAFKNHIGLYPPIRGDAQLMKETAPYAGEKGNLRFPLDQRIPYTLISRLVKHQVKQDREKAAARNKKLKPASKPARR